MPEEIRAKQKIKQKIALAEVNFPKDFYLKIFENYNSDESLALRNLYYLRSVLNGFTLNPTVKSKELLTAWYVDTIVTPMLPCIQKYLLENPKVFNKVLQPGYDKETLVIDGQLICIEEPLVVNGEPVINEQQRKNLIGLAYGAIREGSAIVEAPKIRKKREVKGGKQQTKKVKQEKIKTKVTQQDLIENNILPIELTEMQKHVLTEDLILYLSSPTVRKNEREFIEVIE